MNLQPIGPFAWRVPMDAIPRMRVPGVIYASEDLARKAVEDGAAHQVANVATLPGIVGASYAMPDIHWGYGFPIGGVAATVIRDDVQQGHWDSVVRWLDTAQPAAKRVVPSSEQPAAIGIQVQDVAKYNSP
jgi:hypothetical protein